MSAKPPLTRREWYQRGYADAKEEDEDIIRRLAKALAWHRNPNRQVIPDEEVHGIMKQYGYEE